MHIEKAFNKIQSPVMIKTLSKLGVDGVMGSIGLMNWDKFID